jgi:hypothetical protein
LTSALTAGAHTITATYPGEANFKASTGSFNGGLEAGAGFEFSQDTYVVAERGGSITIV